MNMDELDDFQSIEESGTDSNSEELSNVFQIKIGGFGNSGKLRTYFGSAKVDDLFEDISLYETLTKDKSWPVSQIIQREVNKTRVSEISKSYILGEGRVIKYFPPIIVAILPKAEDGKIALKLNFNPDNSEKIKTKIYNNSSYSSNEKIKPFVIKSKNISLIEGLYVLEVSKVFDTNLLTWDKNKLYAIVIDGQHRLESLFKSKEENPLVGQYLQDVVFLDFSPLIKEDTSLSPVEVVRRVFIDINTNAQRVGFVRQVLMDDKDLASLCVQSIVDSTYSDGTSKSEDSYIKSQIVDWYGDKLKHTLPHLTGILSLYQIIDDYLVKDSLSSFKELRSPQKVKRWVARINNLFMVDQSLVNDPKYKDRGIKGLGDSLDDYELALEESHEYSDDMEDEFKETEIFQYDYRVLDIARAKFEEIYLKPLVKFFNDIDLHKKTIELIHTEGGFGKNIVLSSALISSRKKIANSKPYRNAITSLKIKIHNELHSKYFILFTVLGQKVLFNSLFQKIIKEVDPEFNEKKCFEVTNKFTEELNRLFDFTGSQEVSLFSNKGNITIKNIRPQLSDLGTISNSFWEGLIYENDNIIYNTQGVRTFSFILKEFLRINENRINENSIKEDCPDFDLSSAPYVAIRISRILTKTFGGTYDEEQIKSFCNDIIELKSKYINDYFKKKNIN